MEIKVFKNKETITISNVWKIVSNQKYVEFITIKKDKKKFYHEEINGWYCEE
jgi:hypothetical protein